MRATYASFHGLDREACGCEAGGCAWMDGSARLIFPPARKDQIDLSKHHHSMPPQTRTCSYEISTKVHMRGCLKDDMQSKLTVCMHHCRNHQTCSKQACNASTTSAAEPFWAIKAACCLFVRTSTWSPSLDQEGNRSREQGHHSGLGFSNKCEGA